MTKSNHQRNSDLFDYLTMADEQGYAPSYRDAAELFGISHQRVRALFCHEWTERGADMELPAVRDGRPPMTEAEFVRKYHDLIALFQTGVQIAEVARRTGYPYGTCWSVYLKCGRLGFIEPPEKPAERLPVKFLSEGILM